jgi:hypothetical protein
MGTYTVSAGAVKDSPAIESEGPWLARRTVEREVALNMANSAPRLYGRLVAALRLPLDCWAGLAGVETYLAERARGLRGLQEAERLMVLFERGRGLRSDEIPMAPERNGHVPPGEDDREWACV